MDEIKDCAREFFQRKRRATVAPVNENTAPPNAVQPAVPQQVQPAPPLHCYGQQAEQQQQQANMMYNPVEYVTDAITGATLMAL